MDNDLIPAGQVAPAPKIERLVRADLSITSVSYIPGGLLGKMTKATVNHKTLGERTFIWPINMSPEAVLDWLELTVPAHLYKKGDADFAANETPQEKPVGVWNGDPLAEAGDKAALVASLRASGKKYE